MSVGTPFTATISWGTGTGVAAPGAVGAAVAPPAGGWPSNEDAYPRHYLRGRADELGVRLSQVRAALDAAGQPGIIRRAHVEEAGRLVSSGSVAAAALRQDAMFGPARDRDAIDAFLDGWA